MDESNIAKQLGQIHGQLYHYNEGLKDLRHQARDQKHETVQLRRELAAVRETVARMEGRDEGAVTVARAATRRRERWSRVYELGVASLAAAGCVLGGLAAFH